MLIVKLCGYLAAFGHFQMATTENGNMSKSGIFITQSLFMTLLPYLPEMCTSENGTSQELVKDALFFNTSFKIQDGSQLWPVVSVNTPSK